jgi:hypothetical protein
MCLFVMSILNREGSVLHIIVQDTGSSSRKQTSLLEVNLINIGPSTREDLLLHVRHKQPGRREADILSDNNLALTLASQSESTGDGQAGDSLLRAGDAAEVEALQREVGRLVAGGLQGRGAVEALAEDVLHGDVGVRVRFHASGGDGDVDHVEAVPVEASVGADGLEGCYGEDNFDVIELEQVCQLGVEGAVLFLLLTLAFCCCRPMVAALARIAGMARTAANFMVAESCMCM